MKPRKDTSSGARAERHEPSGEARTKVPLQTTSAHSASSEARTKVPLQATGDLVLDPDHPSPRSGEVHDPPLQSSAPTGQDQGGGDKSGPEGSNSGSRLYPMQSVLPICIRIIKVLRVSLW